MDNDELIDRLNTLQAQNIALMQLLAAVINKAGIDVLDEYAARCALFRIVTEPNADGATPAIAAGTHSRRRVFWFEARITRPP